MPTFISQPVVVHGGGSQVDGTPSPNLLLTARVAPSISLPTNIGETLATGSIVTRRPRRLCEGVRLPQLLIRHVAAPKHLTRSLHPHQPASRRDFQRLGAAG